MGWFSKKKKESPKPWWVGMTFQEILNLAVEVDDFLDEFTDYYQEHGWDEYGGIEALAVLLLIERRKDRLSSHNGSAAGSNPVREGSNPFDSANPPYGQS